MIKISYSKKLEFYENIKKARLDSTIYFNALSMNIINFAIFPYNKKVEI